MKLALAILTVALLAGCRGGDVRVEDNGPEFHERRAAMSECLGGQHYRLTSDWLRVACTFAIYGGTR